MDISLYYIKGIHLKQNKPEKVKVKQRKNYGIQKEKKKERERDNCICAINKRII